MARLKPAETKKHESHPTILSPTVNDEAGITTTGSHTLAVINDVVIGASGTGSLNISGGVVVSNSNTCLATSVGARWHDLGGPGGSGRDQYGRQYLCRLRCHCGKQLRGEVLGAAKFLACSWEKSG